MLAARRAVVVTARAKRVRGEVRRDMTVVGRKRWLWRDEEARGGGV